MSGGYKVVPRSLVDMARVVDQTATEYERLSQRIGDMRLGSDALGLLGRMADLPSAYNEGVAEFSEHMRESARHTRDGAQALRNAATVYMAKDEDWWKQFGYM